jgi:beta-mannosidase
MPFDYAQTRKACYQYSWDWAPYMNTAGIWLPVSLVFYKQVKFQYVWIRNKELTEHKAVLDFTCVLDGM